jgi:hypothetical protein
VPVRVWDAEPERRTEKNREARFSWARHPSDTGSGGGKRRVDLPARPPQVAGGYGREGCPRSGPVRVRALGFLPHLIEHPLAHTVRDPLGRAYNRTTHLDEHRVMMQGWADYLDQLRGGAARQGFDESVSRKETRSSTSPGVNSRGWTKLLACSRGRAPCLCE